MHPKVQDYMNKMIAHENIPFIDLTGLGLSYDDIEPLMELLVEHGVYGPRTLYLNNNRIKSFNVSDEVMLQYLCIEDNPLTNFNIKNFPKLTSLTIGNASINPNGFKLLRDINLSENQLTAATRFALSVEQMLQGPHTKVVIYQDHSERNEVVAPTAEILDEYFRLIISNKFSLKYKGNKLNIRIILSELKEATGKNSLLIIDKDTLKETFNTIAINIKKMFPDNGVEKRYLSSNATKAVMQDALDVYEKNLEALKFAVKNDTSILEDVIGELDGDKVFSSVLGQQLLHDLYMAQASSAAIQRLAEWVLSILAENPNLAFNCLLNAVVNGRAGFKSEVTTLKKIIGEIENNPFLLNNYLSFIIKNNMVLKTERPLTWRHKSLSLSDDTLINPTKNPFQLTAYNRRPRM